MHKPTTYLVTGAAGFIGARFVESCNLKGIDLISVDHKEYFTSREEHHTLKFGKTIEIDELLALLEKNDPELKNLKGIIHFGAITDTRETNQTLLNHLNLHYSQKLWNFASTHQIPFFYASSAATYGAGEQGYDDDESAFDLLRPLNLYGESKLHFDQWVLGQEKQGNHPPQWAGFKFFNVYGFGERHKGFMSSVVLHAFDQIKKSGQVTLFKSHRQGIEDGHQKRDFVFVDDIIEVLHFALTKPIARGIYNLGSGKARTFLDLARGVFHALKQPEKIQFIDTPLSIRDKYQYFTEAKMDKLRKEGFNTPFTSLEEGIKKYINRLI